MNLFLCSSSCGLGRLFVKESAKFILPGRKLKDMFPSLNSLRILQYLRCTCFNKAGFFLLFTTVTAFLLSLNILNSVMFIPMSEKIFDKFFISWKRAQIEHTSASQTDVGVKESFFDFQSSKLSF